MNRVSKIVVCCLTLVACLATHVFAQSEIADAAKLGFDTDVLGEIDQVMSTAFEDAKLIGCNAMILKDDQVCYYKQWGQQDAEKDVPVSRDSIWRIYSMSKPITSVAAMQLVEQGKLELDAPVSKYIPGFARLKVLVDNDGEFSEVESEREMTVRDVFRHTSGLTYGFFGNSEVDKRYRKAGILMTNPDLKAMADKMGDLPLKHQPGTRFEYSASTDLLGYLVEVASEQRFDEYLKQHIFDPLGMNDTSFMVPEDKQERFAEMYRANRQSGELEPSSGRSSFRFLNQDNKFFSGGGGLCSTIDDYMQYCRMLLNKGESNGHRVISEDSLKKMWTDQLADIESGPFKFGLGFSIAEQQGDYSWGGAAGTRFWVNPDKNMAMVYMIQINPYRATFGKQMRKIVYKALK